MKNIIILATLTLIALSCSKKEIVPDQEFGSLSGQVIPADVFSHVYATGKSGERLEAKISSNTGSFTFQRLPVGAYNISFPDDPRFKRLDDLLIVVSSGKDLDMGTISFEPSFEASSAISGKLLPIGFGERVTATNLTTNKQYFAVPYVLTGEFMLVVPNGKYKLSFSAIEPAEGPEAVEVTVTGKMVNLGNLECKPGRAGSILAKLNPVSGVASAKVIHVKTGKEITGIINRTDATLNFPVLSEGAYKLALLTNPPFLAEQEVTIDVKPSQITDLGTLSLTEDTDIRKLQYSIDGKKTVRYNVSGTFDGGVLKFSQVVTRLISGIPERQTLEYYTLHISIGNINSPGLYRFGSESSTFSYREVRKQGLGFLTLGEWALSSNTEATLEILSIDPVRRRIKGIFSGSLANLKAGATPSNRSVTDGIFNLDY